MRQSPRLVLSFVCFVCFIVSLQVAVAQQSMVRIASLLLTEERDGWRASFPDGSPSKYSLRSGDLLTGIDSRSARLVGPLALTSAFNAAFSRSVPLTVQRGSQELNVSLWRGDGPVPTTHPAAQESMVSLSDKAPDFTLPTIGDGPLRLSAQRGHWVLLSFWATWCAPCLEEAPILDRLAKHDSAKLTVLALAVSDARSKLDAFVAKNHPSYTILDAGSLQSQPALSYGVGHPGGGGSVPVNVLLRPDGTIAYVQGGYEAPSPLEKQVRDILEGER